MQSWRSNVIAFIHYSIGVLVLLGYSLVDASVEQSVPRYVVPATLLIFGITMWAGCRCAYSFGLRDAKRAHEVSDQ